MKIILSILLNLVILQEIELAPNFQLQYKIQNQSLLIELKTQNTGWFGIGFGQNMTNTNMLIVQIINNKLEANQFYSLGNQIPIQQNYQINVLNQNIHKNNKNILIQIPYLEIQDLIWAFGQSDLLDYHQMNRGSTQIQFQQPQQDIKQLQNNFQFQQSQQDIKQLQNNFQLNNQLQLQYDFSIEENYAYFRIVSQNQGITLIKLGWFAIGFGNSMIDADMWIFEIVNGQIQASDRYSDDYNEPKSDIQLGGQNDLIILGVQNDQTQKIIKFKRLLNTNDKYDKIIQKGKGNLIWAQGSSNRINYHAAQRGQLDVNFEQGFSQINQRLKELKAIHGLGMFIIWGVLVDISIILGRFMKARSNYINNHIYLNSIIILFTILFEIVMMAQNIDKIKNIQQLPQLSFIHFTIALSLTFLLIIQTIIGSLFKIYLQQFQFNKILYKLKITHQILGILTYLLGKINIAIGVYLFKNDLFYYSLGFIFTTFSIQIIFQILYSNEKLKILFNNRIDSLTQSKLFKIFEKTQEIQGQIHQENDYLKIDNEQKNLNFCIFENKIINLENFNHPGGNFIKDQIIGREIGRFIYGAYAIEAQYKDQNPHNHTKYAINLLQQQHIGFVDQQKILNLKKIQQFNISLNSWTKNLNFQFFITDDSKHQLYIVSVFYFHNQYYQINYDLKLQDLGLYFVISDGKTTRNYTVAMCFSQNNLKIIQEIKNYINYENYIINFKQVDNQNLLPLVIKLYPKGQLSKQLHSEKKSFEIRGPFGCGFQISQISYGIHYIITGGTGILPFLDLFFYMLNKTYEYQNSNSKSDYDMPLIRNGFQIILHASFKDKKNIIGYDIINSLAKLCEISGLSWFKAFIRLSKKDAYSSKNLQYQSQKYDQEYINKNIQKHNLQKVFVCGSPIMNFEIPLFLKQNQIPESKIILI